MKTKFLVKILGTKIIFYPKKLVEQKYSFTIKKKWSFKKLYISHISWISLKSIILTKWELRKKNQSKRCRTWHYNWKCYLTIQTPLFFKSN